MFLHEELTTILALLFTQKCTHEAVILGGGMFLVVFIFFELNVGGRLKKKKKKNIKCRKNTMLEYSKLAFGRLQNFGVRLQCS